ncbi:MAG: hypothetical protein JWN95_1144 [Frankiales bacterium]|nr:hypothetical protein [Frankiales bacterium]
MDNNLNIYLGMARLTEALHEPDVDLGFELKILAHYVEIAVSSYLGLSITASLGEDHVDTVLLIEGLTAQSVAASLRLSLAQLDDTMPFVTLYASTPGAFVDLGADLAFIYGLDPDAVRIDCDLVVPTTSVDLSAVASINQAIGVLIGRGRTLEQATAALQQQATAAGTDLISAALLILASLPQ